MVVRVGRAVGRQLGSIHGVSEFGLELELDRQAGVDVPTAVTEAADDLFTRRGWIDREEAPVGFPHVDAATHGASLWFDWVDDADDLLSFVTDLATSLSVIGIDGALVPRRKDGWQNGTVAPIAAGTRVRRLRLTESGYIAGEATARVLEPTAEDRAHIKTLGRGSWVVVRYDEPWYDANGVGPYRIMTCNAEVIEVLPD